ncbi:MULTISPECIES: type 1 glutamine amidotransferase [Phaeobacter]|uniref:type 1 glutamine amidotransferase n=1 Tax=Phaeobacter TaxID=302485 RepID=UPI003A86578C
MTEILIVESSSPNLASSRRQQGRAAPQNFARVFSAAIPGIKIRVAEPYKTEMTRADFAGVDGIVMTGAGDEWPANDDLARPIRAACDLAFETGRPVLGVCYGLQIGTICLGGEIAASPKGKETGLALNVELTEEGAKHPMMKGRRSGFSVACAHRDEVTRMPDGGDCLAFNAHSAVQAMAVRQSGADFWGLQYHPEISPSIVANAIRENGSLFFNTGVAVEDLLTVESDPETANRLGCLVDDFEISTRTRELTNWIQYVAGQTALTA